MAYRSVRKKRLQSILGNGGSDLDSRDASIKSIRKALRKGLIKRPSRCSYCKRIPGVDAKGNPKIEAVHLKGYAPEHRFDFEWLCVSCRSRAVWAKKRKVQNG